MAEDKTTAVVAAAGGCMAFVAMLLIAFWFLVVGAFAIGFGLRLAGF